MNKNKTLLIGGVVILIIYLVFLYFSQSLVKYSNMEYGYSFDYQKSAEIIFISSLTDSLEVSGADTISVEFKSGKSLRIQAISPTADIDEKLCEFSTSNDTVKLCLSSPNGVNLFEDKEFAKLIKSIRFENNP